MTLHSAVILCFCCVILLLYTRLVRSARPQNVVSSMPNIHREERGIPSPTLVQLPPALEPTLGLFMLRDLEINGIWQAAG